MGVSKQCSGIVVVHSCTQRIFLGLNCFLSFFVWWIDVTMAEKKRVDSKGILLTITNHAVGVKKFVSRQEGETDV